MNLLSVIAASRRAVAPPGGAFEVEYLQNHSSNVSGNKTFVDCNLGAADINRIIIITVAHRTFSASAGNPSVSVGGVDATSVINQYDAVNKVVSSILYASVPSGATGNIVVSFPITNVNCSVGLYRVIASGFTVQDTAGDTQLTLAQVSLNATAGSAIIAVMCQRVDNNSSFVISGVTQDHYYISTGVLRTKNGSTSIVEANAAYEVTASSPGNRNVALVAACFKNT